MDGSMYFIGSHSLFLSLRGVPRIGNDSPLVVFIAGVGDVASSYPAVSRLVGSFAPLVVYDRSGLGRSEKGPNEPTAAIAAVELQKLLNSAGLEPPLLLVAHSFGAFIAREYLHLYPDQVEGMVLVDAATERMGELYLADPDLDIEAVRGSLNFAQVSGLRAAAQVSREEWRIRAADISRGMRTWQAERARPKELCQTLASKKQFERRALGGKPLSVLRCRGSEDYRRIYEKGVEAGNGTEAQRAAFRRLLDRWDLLDQELQEEQLRLSSNSRLVYLPDCGHHAHLIRPDAVAGEIRWVRGQILNNKSKAIGKL